MEVVDFIIWTNACVCLLLTTLVTFWVLYVVKREQAPVIYYINLLTSNLIQLILTIFFKHGQQHRIILIIFIIVVMVTVYFRVSIAMERCFVIARPQSKWIRQTGGSMLVSVLVWILCIIILPLSMFFQSILPLFIFSLLPASPFILFLAWTFKALPAATSVPTDEKRRIVGTVVLLFIQYFLLILTITICVIAEALGFYDFAPVAINITLVLFLLSRYVDLILAFFLRKGSIDKLLSCLCCCITDDTAANVAGYQQLHELMLQQERKGGKVNQIV